MSMIFVPDVLQEQHRVYCQKVEDVKAVQKKCVSAIAHQRYRIKWISDKLKKWVNSNVLFYCAVWYKLDTSCWLQIDWVLDG